MNYYKKRKERVFHGNGIDPPPVLETYIYTFVKLKVPLKFPLKVKVKVKVKVRTWSGQVRSGQVKLRLQLKSGT